MKKFYKEISALLESVPSDKYIHYNVCLLIAYALMRTHRSLHGCDMWLP